MTDNDAIELKKAVDNLIKCSVQMYSSQNDKIGCIVWFVGGDPHKID